MSLTLNNNKDKKEEKEKERVKREKDRKRTIFTSVKNWQEWKWDFFFSPTTSYFTMHSDR